MDTSTSQPDLASKTSGAVTKRYKDAYRVARFTNGLGGAIKLLGLLIGVGVGSIIAILSQSAYRFRGPEALVIPIVVGGIIFLAFYIWGVLISAVAQLLKASLDSAVNSSPFLDNNLKAKVMSLL